MMAGNERMFPMNTEMKKLNAALGTIAAIFTETYEYTDNHGVTEVRNSYGFVQDRVLNGICYQLASSLDYTKNQTLPRALSVMRQAKRAHDGTEISTLAVEKATDWVERLFAQIEYVEAALAVASDRYTEATGKVFGFIAKGRNVPDQKPEEMSELDRKIAHLEAQAKAKAA